MPMFSSDDQGILQAGLRAVQTKMGRPQSRLHGATMTALMKHGGLYTFLEPEMTSARLTPLMSGEHGSVIQAALQKVQSTVESFFYKLLPGKSYTINSDLMSFISFPHDGIAYEDPPPAINKTIPAVFTFVGQFIDHDLTMNAVNLTLDQSNSVIVDNASPVIDLDSVYGPRTILNNALHVDDQGNHWDIFNEDGTFKLDPVGNGFDLPRFKQDPLEPAYIVDGRNDENQLILQIHILVMRVHNAFIKSEPAGHWGQTRDEIITAVRKEVVLNWQSVVLHDYMPKIIEPKTLEFILTEIKKENYGALKHKPLRDLVTGCNVVRMPHEFAIGFRFGHSQLRPSYQLNGGPSILLFNNRKVEQTDDLRGSRKLAASHIIDWDVFYPLQAKPEHDSLAIDGKITPAVFDLPETAIPDDIKFVGNLPQRNLIRSRMIGVASGEELADFYNVPELPETDIVDETKYPQAKALFTHDGPFKTPLWYYILKEAEKKGGGEMLGPLGSRLVGEVLAGGIYYGDDFRFDDNWKSQITGKNEVTLRDLIKFGTK